MMVSSKETNNFINHAQKFALINSKPQHSRNIATPSRLTHQCSSRQQQRIENTVEECQNIFQDPNGVPLHFQVKHSIELVLGSSLPNTSVYRISIINNEEIHNKTQDLINNGHIQPKSSPYGIPFILIPKKYRTWRM